MSEREYVIVTLEWKVKFLNDDFRVGGGLYLVVPVKDCQEAETIKDRLADTSRDDQ